MKKKTIILLSAAFTLCSCSNNNSVKRKEQFKREFDVLIDYGNIVDKKANVVFSEDINLDGVRIFSKTKNMLTDQFICGEKLEVYYKTSDFKQIDYAVLDSDDLICLEMTNAIVPGSTNIMDIFPNRSESSSDNIGILTSNIKYVINEDNSFTYREELEMFSKLWGIYKKEDIEVVEINDHLGYRTSERVELIAVYSFEVL